MPTVVQSAGDPAASVPGTTDVAGASDSDAGRGRMRRVASAPAFKHASCYHELSPTAAVAAAVAASCPASSSGRQQSHAAPLPNVPPCSSCNGRGCNCLEVYVVSRSFSEFAGPVMKRLHPDAREHLVAMGICHYMTVFKTPDGQLVQFDFGPLGGDVQKAHGPLATFLRRARAASQQHQQQEQQQQDRTTAAQASTSSSSSSVIAAPASSVVGDNGGGSGRGMVHSPSAPSLPLASLDLARDGGEAAAVLMQLEAASNGGRPKRGVVGEIRERSLQQLPSACMYMGRTSLSLEDIRQYNAAQGRQTYTLHENDCRHYVNSLVQYTTGVERSTQHLKRHYFHSRHADKWLWYGWFISASQLVTDVGNWSHIQAGAAVTLLAVTGRSTLASLKTLATPMLPALKGLPALLPSAGLTAAAAATAGAGTAAPGAAAAAATAGGGSGATVIGTLATTLKLPATLLLRRPLAAGAAAGSAGAAAAALRDTSDTAAAAAATTGGSRRQHWRPLHSLGDGMAHGLRSAMLGLRRLALGNTRALQQLQQQPLIVQEPAAATKPRSGRGFWGGSNRATDSSSAQQRPPRGWFKRRGSSSNQLQLVGQPGTPSMLAAPAAMAAAGATPGWQQDQQQDQQQQQVGGQPLRRRPLAQFTQQVGRHVVWLGSSAARASSQLVLLALGGSRVAQHASAHPAAAGDASRVLVHSASSHQLQQQVLAPSGLNAGHRSLSMPSLLTAAQDTSRAGAVAAAAAAASSAGGSAGGSVACAAGMASGDGLGLCGPDMAFMWDSSSSIICSGIGSKPTGVGRQVLNLPAPRISWGKRASQAVITRQ